MGVSFTEECATKAACMAKEKLINARVGGGYLHDGYLMEWL